LRIGIFDRSTTSLDHEATWLLGHTGKMAFSRLRRRGEDLLVNVVLHARCRHLQSAPDGMAECRAFGFRGPTPPAPSLPRQPRQLGEDRFLMVQRAELTLGVLRRRGRSLPVLNGPNPCATAPCTTADHTRGAACCRDLQIEILCGSDNIELESLVRSRQSPYLCKVTRESDGFLEAEVISSCGYLDPSTRGCTLHGLTRPDGRPAKPDLCSDWPADGKGLHPGCIFDRKVRG
jgi:hypothetical protein